MKTPEPIVCSITPRIKDSPKTSQTIAAPMEITYPSSMKVCSNWVDIEAHISPWLDSKVISILFSIFEFWNIWKILALNPVLRHSPQFPLPLVSCTEFYFLLLWRMSNNQLLEHHNTFHLLFRPNQDETESGFHKLDCPDKRDVMNH